ncbi:expansin EXLX1 family cellulose-binding protein [Streptomyces sp. NPDC046909]|uniref:expansin EXLX1 family cellulose-binding protein n=1 Tax=Streptomyces sp. NPDC046909 TaxID=3155617 RepID=UPI0033D08437
MASPSHHRRPRRQATWVLPVLGVAALALVASLIAAFAPDRGSDSGSESAAPVAGAQLSAAPSTPAATTPSATPSPTPSASKATPSAKTSTPAASRTTASPRRTTAPVATGSAAGRIRPGTTYDGVATFYDAGDGGGACSYGPTSDVMTAAMNHTDYETSKACGAYVRVRASGGATITVRITNECPLPCAPGQLDLSAQAFAKLAEPSRGQIPVTWTLLSPATSEKISIRYKTGSSQYWCGIQAIGHRNPLARLEVRTGSGWTSLPRTDYNYFLSEHGAGCGGEIRITDIYGERLTVSGIAVRPDAVQPAGVQFAAH